MGKLIGISLFLAAATAAWAVWHGRGEDPLAVHVVTVREDAIRTVIAAPGRIVAERKAVVSAMTSGRIEALETDEGDAVKAGQPLVGLDDTDQRLEVERAQALLRQRRAELGRAQRELRLTEQLVRAGGEAREVLDGRRDDLRVVAAQAEVAEKDLAQAERGLDKLAILAPLAGVVRELQVSVGEWVSPSTVLCEVVDVHRIAVEAQVPAADIAAVHPGQRALIASESRPDEVIEGRVEHLAPAVDPTDNTNTIIVRIALEGSDDRLRIDEHVDVKIVTAEKAAATVVPFGALIEEESRTLVAVIEDGRIGLIPVRTGIESLTHVEILEGLQAGDRIVLPEGHDLAMGAPVHELGMPTP